MNIISANRSQEDLDGTVLVPIIIDDAIGIAGDVITLEFDGNVVSMEDVSQTDVTAGFIFERNILDNEVRFVFANATGFTSADGVIANIAIMYGTSTD